MEEKFVEMLDGMMREAEPNEDEEENECGQCRRGVQKNNVQIQIARKCEKYIYSTFVSTVLIVVEVLISAYDQKRY